ncbi:MAG: TonB-dependent receptor domain-containing protein [Bacteroidota bacterium]
MKKMLVCLVFLCLFSINKLVSQNIVIKVSDKTSNSPIEFASVNILKLPDSTSVFAGLSDSLGFIKFRFNAADCYLFKVENHSYKKYLSTKFCAENFKETIKLRLFPASQNLNEVTIESQKNLFKLEGEKKVFDVSSSIAAVAGTAVQVLQQVPTVNVDIDGNISVRGNSNVVVLIDGKPSGITGANRQAVLDQIPAANIQQIEVITNPSSRYDADGMAGIINIVLKKNNQVGYNANLTFSIGTNNKYSGNAGASFKRKNANIGVFYSYRKNPIWGYGNSFRDNYFADTSFYFRQYSTSNNDNETHNVRLTSDFNLNKSTVFTYSISATAQTKSEQEDIQYFNYSPQDIFRSMWIRNVNTSSNSKNAETNFFLKKSFLKKAHELSISGNASYNESFSTSQYNNTGVMGYPSSFWSKQLNPINSIFRIAVLQTDYTNPIKEKVKLDAGLKTSLRNISNDFTIFNQDKISGNFISNPIQSNQFRYNEIVSAAYVILSGSKNKLNFQAGLRTENTLLQIQQLTIDSSINRSFTDWFPNLNINYTLNKKTEIQLAFSKRLNRPGPQSLNPFSDFSDPQNVRVGNPFLLPEYIYATEATFSNRNKLGTFILTGYFRHITNSIQRYRIAYPDGTAFVTVRNFSFAQNTGSEFIWRADLSKNFNFTTNVNLYYTKLKGGSGEGELTNDNFNYNIKLISSSKLFNWIDLQVTGVYNARTILLQGYFAAIYGLDIGLKKDILKNKGSISLNVSDVFDTRRFEIYTKAQNFESLNKRKRETLIANLAFTYKIGQSDNSTNKKRGNRENTSPDFNNDLGW